MTRLGFGADKTTYDNVDWAAHGEGGMPATIDVKDGKILRTRPFKYDESYSLEHLRPWKLEYQGKVFEEPTRSLISPPSIAYKRHAFSRNRILHPLIREDWDPDGERNPQNRGKSKFKRISWDDATEIIAREIKRQYKVYGPGSILSQQDGHGETKIIHAPHGCMAKLLDLTGGYTLQERQPDSWEGWYWGAKHTWGGDPLGIAWYGNLFKDVTYNTKMVLYWGCDNESTTWAWTGQLPSLMSFWWSDCGIMSVAISPELNYSGACHADRWIPVYPNTDLALQFAIAYVWIKESLYDKEYVDTHTIGFDWLEYEVMGGETGVVKTPEWAAPLCGVPSRIIKALARKWARDNTTIAHCCGGSYIRSAYSHEPARMEACLLTMQGLGKPGRNHFKFGDWDLFGEAGTIPTVPSETRMMGDGGYNGGLLDTYPRFIPKTLIPQAIAGKETLHWWGHVICALPAENQFNEYSWPREGEPFIHMIWSDSPCWATCWNCGNAYTKTLTNENLDFVLIQHPWFENDCRFADIILPICTRYEVEDVGTTPNDGLYSTLLHSEQAVEKLGESVSDWECVQRIADKLGLLDEYLGGRTVENCVEATFDGSGAQMYESYDEFIEKGYFSSPMIDDWYDLPAGMEKFAEDPEANPLDTPSGKVEIYSPRLAEKFPDDKERMPYPHYIAATERHHEYREDPKAEKYPFLMVSNHPHWRTHAEYDDNAWLREIETCKVIGPDGYAYEPAWINPVDGEKLGVKSGDVVKLFNDRGWVLGGVYITERIKPGVVLQDHGARTDFIVPGESDRGGANNLIAPLEIISANCAGEVTSGYLVGIEKIDVFELAEQYPEAFGRTFRADEGVDIDNWLL